MTNIPFRSVVYFFAFSILLISCQPNSGKDVNSISNDSLTIIAGKNIFNAQCSSCHNFRQDAIGPQLSGITKRNTPQWIRNFIKSPKAMINSHDSEATRLFNRYHVIMPSFDTLSDKELNSLVAYINSHRSDKVTSNNAPKKPITAPVLPSDLIVGLQYFTQVPASGKEPKTRIVKIDNEPGKDQFYILDQRGKLYRLNNNQPEEFLDLAKTKNNFINQPGLATGFGSFAFHPDFAKNGLFYTTHSEAANSKKADFNYGDSIKSKLQWVITEWKTNHPGEAVFSGTSRELFRIDMISQIHGVQEISFNPFAKKGSADYGLLYIGVGDGGTVENGHPEFAHNTNKIWGSIIRIDPLTRNSLNGQYGIPARNPFAGKSSGNKSKEIFAYGFRNPNHFSWTPSGTMIATNIGQGNIESVNVILAGHDYGWPLREGTFVVNPLGDLNHVDTLKTKDSLKISYPAAEYDHSEGKAIAGGFDYYGKSVAALKGKYFFGDIVSGRLYYINLKDIKQGKLAPIYEWNISLNGKKVKLKDICGGDRVDLKFGRDIHGEMFLFTKADGKVYRLVNQ